MDVLRRAAALLEKLGRLDESIALKEYLAVRDPVSPGVHVGLGASYFYADRMDEAIASCRTGQSLNPGGGGANFVIGVALLWKNQPEEALAAMEQETYAPFRELGLTMAYHALGRAAESDSLLAEVIEELEPDWAYNIAYVEAFRGEADAAFEWLDEAAQVNDPGLSLLAVPIQFENIMDDPRWLPFLESIGKSPEQLAEIEFEVRLPQ
jgi:tetratricopeptide (TPR) repeat protein